MPYSWGGGQLFGFFCGNQAQKNVGKSFDFLCVFLNLDYLGILEKKKNVFLNLLPFFLMWKAPKPFKLCKMLKKMRKRGKFWNFPAHNVLASFGTCQRGEPPNILGVGSGLPPIDLLHPQWGGGPEELTRKRKKNFFFQTWPACAQNWLPTRRLPDNQPSRSLHGGSGEVSRKRLPGVQGSLTSA